MVAECYKMQEVVQSGDADVAQLEADWNTQAKRVAARMMRAPHETAQNFKGKYLALCSACRGRQPIGSGHRSCALSAVLA